jgi:hypothetical protein
MEMRSRVLLGALGVLLFCGVSYGLAFTIIGDWGVPNLLYTPRIAEISQQKRSQFTVAIGDNFYKGVTIGGKEHGVSSIDDPKWKAVFEDQFPISTPFFRNRFYVIAGNHDYDGDMRSQINYSNLRSKRWYFPKRYYKFTKPAPANAKVEFFMLDSHVIANSAKELNDYDLKVDMKQLERLKIALRRSKATWKLVFSHHPVYHNKGENEFFVRHLVPTMEKENVAAFISGHMHYFMHIKSPKIHYITVGNTGIQTGVPTSTKKLSNGAKRKYLHPTAAEFPNCGKCVQPTTAKFPNCGARADPASFACRGFAVVTVKDKKTMVLDYFTSKGDNSPKHSIVIKNPKK